MDKTNRVVVVAAAAGIIMNQASFELMLDWAGDAVYETDTVIPKFFRNANELLLPLLLDENSSGYSGDAFGMMYYEEQASFQIQRMSEAVACIPIEKWDCFLKNEGGWPEHNRSFENRCAMRKLVYKFLKENLGFGVSVVSSSSSSTKYKIKNNHTTTTTTTTEEDTGGRFWVNEQIEEFIAEEMDAIQVQDKKKKNLAGDLRSTLREAFHKTVQHYISKVSYHAYNKGDW